MEVLREMLEQIDRERRNKMKQESASPPVTQRYVYKMNGLHKSKSNVSEFELDSNISWNVH